MKDSKYEKETMAEIHLPGNLLCESKMEYNWKIWTYSLPDTAYYYYEQN